jgi:hypothetical protein
MKSYCYYCDKEVEYRVGEKVIDLSIEGIAFSYSAKIPYCKECGEEIYIKEFSDTNMVAGHKVYKSSQRSVEHGTSYLNGELVSLQG